MRWPRGLTSAGAAAGIKRSGKLDLGLLVADAPVAWAGAFTRNAAAAACVGWCREALGRPVRAIVVNSGNANACTGPAGRAAVEKAATAAAEELGCEAGEVLVCSTGPIGIPLDPALVAAALPEAFRALRPQTDDFARSILTTDSHPKHASASAGGASFVGVAKGAAMVAPNMATMLAFIGTDASVSADELQSGLDWAVRRTFNRLCIDACESTNDSVVALASATGPSVEEGVLRTALGAVCSELALQIARDAEGGTKLVRVRVSGARDEDHAVALGRAVASSDLWRAAAHGADPNWGRVLSAVGAADRSFELGAGTLRIGDETLFAKGEPRGSLEVAAAAMRAPEFTVALTIGAGPAEAEVLTADLSEDYVKLNAEGTT